MEAAEPAMIARNTVQTNPVRENIFCYKICISLPTRKCPHWLIYLLTFALCSHTQFPQTPWTLTQTATLQHNGEIWTVSTPGFNPPEHFRESKDFPNAVPGFFQTQNLMGQFWATMKWRGGGVTLCKWECFCGSNLLSKIMIPSHTSHGNIMHKAFFKGAWTDGKRVGMGGGKPEDNAANMEIIAVGMHIWQS